ncbi:hypothetical protein CF326_g4003 [Tilletia indica]|nr:hypothetical protein CF326_g4003 [Tilletia indica]
MTLLLAPYNNAMRLGQGFNSYTQQICIDDAVVASPHRAENFISNTGQTMRTIAQGKSEPSLWTRSSEVLMDEGRIAEAKAADQEIISASTILLPDERQEKIRALERKRAEGIVSSAAHGTSAPPPYQKHSDSSFAEEVTRSWRIDNIGGPSQTVTFTSRFVDSLSQITKDMGISASLSIKAGMVAGSGRGSFVDSDKFLNSDLNYYISVHVTNQSTNFRDMLEFNPMADGIINGEDFVKVYGDSFISSFLEGGEFNAIVSMKVLNTVKLTEIEAAAKVAFSSGALDVEASAAFRLAKSNINLNTETTITCSWSGGGAIKHPNEPWTIESLMRAAYRFPENVAHSPQRTYAVLQKYDHLRSFLALKPPALSKMSYENVALYTEELMDSFMVYKAMLSTLDSDIRQIQQGTKRFRPDQPDRNGGFAASIDGLEAACQKIRPQLSLIVQRVEQIERKPSIVSNFAGQDYDEQFESPVAFWDRLPIIESVKTGQASRPPLSGRRIGPSSEEQSSKEGGQDVAREALLANVCESEPMSLSLTALEEKKLLKRLSAQQDKTGPGLRLTRPVGSREHGLPFFAFDFIKSSISITDIAVGVAQGSISSISISYSNGIRWHRGRTDDEQETYRLNNLTDGETFISGVIEYGKPVYEPGKDETVKGTITSLKLCTREGRTLRASAVKQERYGFQCRYLDDRLFTDLEEFAFESPMTDAALIGFYGLSAEVGEQAGVHRLGFVWSSNTKIESGAETKAATCAATTEMLIGSTHAPALLDSQFEATLLPVEKAALLSPAARSKNRGLRFGPCIGTEPNPGGEVFNDSDLLSTMQMRKVEWPTQIVFTFKKTAESKSGCLVSFRISYGKLSFVHGVDVCADSSDHIRLDVKLEKGETIRSLNVQTDASAGPSSMPTGISVVTNRSRTISSSSALTGTKEISGFQGMIGLKGFFGFESDAGISRLLPIWA